MPDEQQVSNKQIQWSYWYLTHRPQLKRALVVALIVLCVVFWGYSIIRLTYLVFVEEPRTQAAVAGLPQDLVHVRDHLQPLQDIAITATNVFSNGDKRVDFYAHIQNPNKEYAARSFTYTFSYDGGETPEQKGYLLPDAEMDLYALGITDVESPRNAQLLVKDVSWKRILGWDNRRADTLHLPVTDIAVTPIANDARGGVAVTFVLTNDTTYGFWAIDVPMILLAGSRVIGMNALRLTNIQSAERRPVTFQWFGAPRGATSVRVTPQVNVLDPSVFQAVRGGQQRF